MKQFFIVAIYLLLFGNTRCVAQTVYAGKEFHLTLGGFVNGLQYPTCAKGTIILMSKHTATVNFYYHQNANTASYTVSPGVPTYVYLTSAELRSISGCLVEQVTTNSLLITSDSNITVQFGNREIAREDAMTILPSDGEGNATEYYLLGIKGAVDPGFTFANYGYSIVANCDSVTLEITPAAQTLTHPPHVPVIVTLKKGEIYPVGTKFDDEPGKDISGTHVKVLNASCCFPVNTPINVFNTYSPLYANYPNTVSPPKCCADILLEQILPVNWWTTEYPVVPFWKNTKSLIRVVSSENNNQVRLDNTPIATLNKGDIFDTAIAVAHVVTSDHPVGIGHFMLSDGTDTVDDNGDPDMLWCFPMQRGIKDAYIPLVLPTYPLHEEFLTVITTAVNAPTVTLNNVPLGTQLNAFPGNSNYMFAHVPLNTVQSYRLKSQDPIIAYYGTIYQAGSYTLPAADINGVYHGSTDTTRDTLTLCGPADTLLLHGEPIGMRYLWSTGDTSSFISVTSEGSYTLVETSGCGTFTRYRTFTVLKRDFTVTDTSVCQGSAAQISGSGDPGYTYTWSPTLGLSDPSILNPVITTDTTRTYTITGIHPDCPDLEKQITVTVEPVPLVDAGKDRFICSGDTIHLHPIVLPGWFSNYLYSWSPVSNISNPAVRDIVYAGNGEGTLILEVITPIGCKGSDTIKITVSDVLLINVTPDFIAKYGEQVQLHAEGARYYSWTPTRLLDFPNMPDPKAHALDSATFQIIGLNEYGCRDTAYVRMDIDYDVREIVPSAFSPNKDGVNDVFRIGNIGYQRLLEFRIYNRWGQEVFSTLDASEGWDGSLNGVPQDIGVYHYLIRIARPDGQQKIYKGDVSLIR